ncbi:MAG: hypothetical protein P8179_17945 [Candidatus Thiodiazotropha sp.]
MSRQSQLSALWSRSYFASSAGGAAGQESLLHIHIPPQACHSRCSVIHPTGDHGHRSYFLQNQEPAIRMERSTDFFRMISLPPLKISGCRPIYRHEQA